MSGTLQDTYGFSEVKCMACHHAIGSGERRNGFLPMWDRGGEEDEYSYLSFHWS